MEEEAGLADIFGASSEAQEAPKIEYHYAQYRRNVATTETDDLITLQMVKKHALWGDHLWNGGCWLARHLDSHPGLVCGKRVAELGAGAGLPSVIACRLGASRVVCTDYPDSELIDNIATNLRTNCPGQENRAIARVRNKNRKYCLLFRVTCGVMQLKRRLRRNIHMIWYSCVT